MWERNMDGLETRGVFDLLVPDRATVIEGGQASFDGDECVFRQGCCG